MTKDRRLGKGLAALLGTPIEEDQIVDGTSTSASDSQPSTSKLSKPDSPKPPISQKVQGDSPAKSGKRPHDKNNSVRKVPLNRGSALSGPLELSVYEIDNNPFQPRRKFNEQEIESLAESIREHQQLQPILVRKVGERFQLISGERRLRATIHAGLTTIRAEVREADDRLVAELAIVENLQRKDLDAIEKALSFRRYIDEHRCKQEDLAKRLKIDRSTIANLMRLLELPEEIQQWIQSEKITAGHARALLPLGNEDQQVEFARLIVSEAWNVRETERRVTEQLDAEDGVRPNVIGKDRTARKRVSPQLAALEQQLRLALGTKTEIRQNARGRGKITITFANAEEFERICQLIQPDRGRRVA